MLAVTALVSCGRPPVSVVAAVGDIACTPAEEQTPPTPRRCQGPRVAAAIRRDDVDAVLLLGDIQYERGELSDYRASFDRSWGALGELLRPAPGNHDYGVPRAEGYFSYFGTRAGPRRRGYYSFNLGSWHIISLNSQCRRVGGCGPRSEQGRWLARDLARHSDGCQLAFWHHPRFSSGKHGDSDRVSPLWQQLQRHQVELVLSGHDHDYERFAPLTDKARVDPGQGVRSFVVGTGGSNYRRFEEVKTGSEKRIEARYGYLRLMLEDKSYRWQFLTTDGDVLDRGHGRCR